MGIVYAPDYVINSGGVINVADELDGYNRERALNVLKEFMIQSGKFSQSQNVIIFQLTLQLTVLAEERIARVAKSRSQFLTK